MTLERGTLLHKRYRIVEILGQGGMGSVYRAVDENLGVDVAVKENLFTTDEYARQFRLEAVILANLRHPNLPRVTDHFVIGDQGQYLVMDYIEGEDLRQRMERMGVLPEEDVILIGAAMCDALTYLHSRKPPILHRDIKPGNVKITPEGHIYLVDFGLAKVVQGSQVTTTGARAMTPGYSPPEQYGTARTDPRSDIYSLGATLYAAISGVIPEDGLARAMDNTQLTPLRKRNGKVSRRLSAAIEKAMAVDSEDRFQNGDGFKQALLASSSKTSRLDSVAGSFSIEPPPEPVEEPEPEPIPEEKPAAREPEIPPRAVEIPSQPSGKPRKKIKRPGCLWTMFIFLVLVISGLLGLSYFAPAMVNDLFTAVGVPLLSPTPQPSATPTMTPTMEVPAIIDTPTPSPTLEPTHTARPTNTLIPTYTPFPTATPLGGGIGEFAFASERTGIAQIYIGTVDNNLPPKLLTNMPEGACQPTWSPDGEQLVFVSPCTLSKDPYKTYPNSTLYISSADGSGITQLMPENGGDFEPAWSPDGTRITFTSTRDGYPQIYVYTLASGELTRLTETNAYEPARYPTWSPLGNQIAYTMVRFEAYQIWVMTDLGQAQQQIVRSGQQLWDFMPIWDNDGETLIFSQRYAAGPARPWLMIIKYTNRDDGVADEYWRRNVPTTDISLSPDGKWLLFESVSEDNYDIFLIPAGGGDPTRMTVDPGIDLDPVWRPVP